ncbi:MAG: MipA/OmpV family protein [Cetobacterium sp.]
MKKVLMGLLALTISATMFAEDKFGIGVGMGISDNMYKGAESKAYPMPLLDVNYGNLYIKGVTLGYQFYKDDTFAASLFLNPLAGFTVEGQDLESGYNKIDDREFGAMFGIKLDANTGFYGVRTGLSAQFGERGGEGKLNAFKAYKATEKLTIIPSIYIKGYSKDYTDYYFGVTSEEARRVGNEKIEKAYEPNSAYSFGANIAADYKLTDSVALMAFLGVEKFSSEISDSPIVEDDGILYLVGVGAKYYF